MKSTSEKVKEILENANWTAEWCHPHRWSDNDINACIDKISSSSLSKKYIGECIDEALEEAVEEYANRDSDRSFIQLLAEYVADRVAWSVVSRNSGRLYAPESATFKIVD